MCPSLVCASPHGSPEIEPAQTPSDRAHIYAACCVGPVIRYNSFIRITFIRDAFCEKRIKGEKDNIIFILTLFNAFEYK